jgi:nucleoside-diphosphate-sugar epimerase
MRVLITGANGFLGRAVVTAALAAGHEVVALHRPASAIPPDLCLPRLTWIAGDLRQMAAWRDALEGIEGVIHCAAAASGDLTTQMSGTVLATENLLASLPADLTRFVHVSSFSVYDFDRPGYLGALSEDTPLEQSPRRRDAYTQTKLLQERLVRRFAVDRRHSVVIARPGAIYGIGKTWDYGRGLAVGRLDLIFAPLSRMRLIHVDNCADALVAMLTAPVEGKVIINLVDSEQPSHWRFHRLARRAGARTGFAVPVPYALVLALGLAARLADRMFFEGRARVPELLDPPRQRVRWRPLRYDRKRAAEMLGAQQRVSLLDGIAGMVDHTPGQNEAVAKGDLAPRLPSAPQR